MTTKVMIKMKVNLERGTALATKPETKVIVESMKPEHSKFIDPQMNARYFMHII